MQLEPHSYSSRFSDLLRAYYFAPNHPCKLRIFGWLENIWSPKRIAVKTNAGFRFAVDRRDYIQNTVFTTRHWEPEIESILKENLRSTDVFFDIGANVGYFSLYAIAQGCESVVSFEPSDELRSIFAHNLELNGVQDRICSLVPRALGDTHGSGYYETGPLSNSGIGRLTRNETAGDTIIEITTLDQFLESSGHARPTVMKIDVEGWEPQVLRGARNLFTTHPPRIVIFEADCDGSGALADREIEAHFSEFGYRVEHIKRPVIEEKENYLAILTTTE